MGAGNDEDKAEFQTRNDIQLFKDYSYTENMSVTQQQYETHKVIKLHFVLLLFCFIHLY